MLVGLIKALSMFVAQALTLQCLWSLELVILMDFFFFCSQKITARNPALVIDLNRIALVCVKMGFTFQIQLINRAKLRGLLIS